MQQGGERAYALPLACQTAGKQTETRSAQHRGCLGEIKLGNLSPVFKGAAFNFLLKESWPRLSPECEDLAQMGERISARRARHLAHKHCHFVLLGAQRLWGS